jgi:hypothetical protein
MLSSLGYLGSLSCELGDDGQAKIYFDEALQLAMAIQAPYLAYDVLINATQLLEKKARAETALEALAFVLSQSLGQEVRERAQGRFAAVEARLTPVAVQRCRERGQGRQLDEVIERVVGELRSIRTAPDPEGSHRAAAG